MCTLLVCCFASIAVMETLSNMWEKFSLTESEGDKYQVRDNGPVGQYLLAARFFTSRVLNMEAIARTFKLLWHTKKGFEVHDMGDHKVLFVFSEASDVDKVLLGEPCSFDKSLVALKRVQWHTDLKGLIFDSASFWI